MKVRYENEAVMIHIKPCMRMWPVHHPAVVSSSVVSLSYSASLFPQVVVNSNTSVSQCLK